MKTVYSPATGKIRQRLRSKILPMLSERDWWKRRYGCVLFKPMAKQDIILKSEAREMVLSGGQRCLEEGTLVMTPSGPRPINGLRPGDLVYDENGRTIPVLRLFDQGDQQVVDLYHRKIKVASCTKDHRWLTMREGRYRCDVRSTSALGRDVLIERREVDCPLGSVREPHAYVLGAMLGDGCCRQGGLTISTGDESVVRRIAEILGTTHSRDSLKNYTWRIRVKDKKQIPHYSEWLHMKYAHEKIVDMEVVGSWDRWSLLEFVAGLVDTDGSVYSSGDGTVTVDLSMQAKPVIEAFCYALLALFGIQTNMLVDARPRYKNGPVYLARVHNIHNARRILRELTPHLQVERKKYRPVHDEFVPVLSHFNKNGVGVGKGRHVDRGSRVARCFDIEVDSPTNLYLLANGLVTHNSGKSDDGACRLAREAWGIDGLWVDGRPADGAPRHFWAVALSSAKQEDTLKPKLSYFLGPRASWHEAKGLFRLPNGSTITLKSQEAELDKFQSVSLHGIWVDEVGDREDYYEQMRKRLTDHDGWILTTMTPTKGVNWMFRIFKSWQKETQGQEVPDRKGRLFVFLDAEANVYLPTHRLRLDLARIETQERYDMDRFGKFVEIRGLVFPNFSFERHVLKCLVDGKCSLETPAHWPRVRGMDFGHAAPSTCVWIAEDPREKELVVYRELYDRGRSTVPELCEMIKVLSAGEKYQITVLDPSCWKQDPHRDAVGRWHRIADDYEVSGVEVYRGNNDTRGGIEKMSQLMGKTGTRPRLFVHECCRNGIEELESLHWKEGVTEGGVAERIGGDDHFCVAGDTVVSTPTGGIRIKDMVGMGGFDVLAYDEQAKAIVRSRAFAVKTADKAKVVRLGTLVCTPNHPVLSDVGWRKAGEYLLPSANGLRYHALYEPDHHQPDLSGVSGEAVLQERSILRELGPEEEVADYERAHSCEGLGGRPRPSPRRMACASHGSGQGEQRDLELGVHEPDRACFGAHRDTGVGEGLALLERGAPLALEDVGGILAKEEAEEVRLHDLRGGVPFPQERRSDLLRRELSLQGLQAKEPRLLLLEGRAYALSQEEAVYNLYVEKYHTFIANGVVTHNCDGLKYAVNWFWDMWEGAAGGFTPDGGDAEPYSADQPERFERPSLQLRRVENADGTWHYERVFSREKTGVESDWNEFEEEPEA